MSNYTYTPIDFNNSPPQLSMRGLSNDVFTIHSPADNLSIGTQMVFTDSLVGEQPVVDLELSINTETSKILFFNDTSWEETSTTFYHIIHDPDSILFNYTADTTGLIEYTYNSSTQILSSNIISNGKFIANKYMFDKQLWQIYQSEPINFNELSTDISKNNTSSTYINNIIGYKVQNIDILYIGSGYKLNSTFFLGRSTLTSALLPEDCELAVNLCLSNNTVSISGGSDYRVGDTFTIGTTAQTTAPGLIRVGSIDHNGSIVSTDIINNGFNFTSLPTVIDNSSIGTNATISVNDSFGIASCSIISSGNGYNIYDKTISCRYNDVEYIPNNRATTKTDISLLKIVPLLNNNFSLNDILVIQPGNNISEVNFIVVDNNNIIDNNFISINKDHLINIKSLLNITNRPRFQFN